MYVNAGTYPQTNCTPTQIHAHTLNTHKVRTHADANTHTHSQSERAVTHTSHRGDGRDER